MNKELQNRIEKKKAEIAAKIAKLQGLVEDLSKEEGANWGKAGSLGHINQELEDLLGGFCNVK